MSHSKKVWNPRYLSGCFNTAARLFADAGATSPVFELLGRATEHFTCCDAADCKVHRDELKKAEARLRRDRSISSWEYWLLQAARFLLHPVPGTKHEAISMLGSAFREFDALRNGYELSVEESWISWHEQHKLNVPPYLEVARG